MASISKVHQATLDPFIAEPISANFRAPSSVGPSFTRFQHPIFIVFAIINWIIIRLNMQQHIYILIHPTIIIQLSFQQPRILYHSLNNNNISSNSLRIILRAAQPLISLQT